MTAAMFVEVSTKYVASNVDLVDVSKSASQPSEMYNK